MGLVGVRGGGPAVSWEAFVPEAPSGWGAELAGGSAVG